MKKIVLAALVLAPSLAFAQTFSGLQTLMIKVTNLINQALPLIIGIATIGFFWGLATFVFSAGDEEKRKEARQKMIWGIIAIAVMISIWGLVRFLTTSIGLDEGGTINVPRIPSRTI